MIWWLVVDVSQPWKGIMTALIFLACHRCRAVLRTHVEVSMCEWTTPTLPPCQNNACVRTTQCFVSENFGTVEFGGSFWVVLHEDRFFFLVTWRWG
jgi:hypothetical protein|mmetsp:Transcript_76114/g.127957  ORF Transcript_76114/g.127957 Transcript_76114/m.127957 type:complete len:96 (-) Transcript_76114:490-777(-)